MCGPHSPNSTLRLAGGGGGSVTKHLQQEVLEWGASLRLFLRPDGVMMSHVCCLQTGGGVPTHTHVSGDTVKPSMYNCLTLIKGGGVAGGGGSPGAKSPVSKPFMGAGGVAGEGGQLLELVGMLG